MESKKLNALSKTHADSKGVAKNIIYYILFLSYAVYLNFFDCIIFGI